MAAVNIFGGPFLFTITVGTPVVGDVYRVAVGNQFTVTAFSGGVMTSNHNGAANPASSGTLTKISGTGSATLTYTAVTASGVCNISNFTYASGDTLQPSNAVNPFLQLRIDAQVAADVTALAGANFSIYNPFTANSELYVVNTSTTVPLVVKVQGENIWTSQSPLAKHTTRGDWISVGTGTGLDNQTISFASIGGVLIDWPPFVEVETAAGSGVYVTMLNIGGAYNDGYSGSGLTPTAYPVSKTFANVGTTRDNGHFFTFDEQNSTLHFGSAAGGGWIPPNGSNIRYPNIHFTGTSRPNASGGSRNRFTSTGGAFDFSITAFSNRWGPPGQMWCYSFKARHIGYCGLAIQNCPASIDIDYLAAPLDVYQAGNVEFSIAASTANISIDHFSGVGNTAGFQLTSAQNVSKLGEIRSTMITKTSPFQPAIQVSGVSALASAPVNLGPFYCNGNCMYLSSCTNMRINGFYFSDQANGVASATNSGSWIDQWGGLNNVIIQTWRLLSGGVPSTNKTMTSAIGNPGSQVAFHDIVIDGQNPVSHTAIQAGFNNLMGSRWWLANMTLTNWSGAPLVGNTATMTYPNRAINILGAAGFPNIYGGMQFEGVTATTTANLGNISTIGGVQDIAVAHLMRTTSNTAGALYCLAGVIESALTEVVVNSGTVPTDLAFATQTLAIPGNGVQITYTPITLRPIRGVTSSTGCVFTTAGTSSTSGITYEFRIRNHGDTTWPAFATLTAAAFTTAFNALSGYSSTIGFDFSFRITSTTALVGRAVSWLAVTGLTLDAAFVAPEVGFVQIGYSGATNGANVAVINTASGQVQITYTTADATGTAQTEFPYAFDGTATSFQMVARKFGYAEFNGTGLSCYQAGLTVPTPTTLNYVGSLSDADIDAAHLVINGSAKTYAVSASHTILDLYQRAQWWGHQSANMIYDLPLTSKDGSTFTLPTGWTLSGPSYLTGGGTIAGGTVTLDGPGTYTTGFNGVAITAQGPGTYTVPVTSSTITFTPVADNDLYQLQASTLSGTITLHNANSHPITVEVPSGTTTSTTGNTGGLITVTNPLVYQTVTVSGFTAGSRLQIYDTTNSVQLFNGTSSSGNTVVSGTTATWTDPSGAAGNRAIRLRVAYQNGTSAKTFIDTNIGTCGTTSPSNAVSYLVAQTNDTTYNTNAIDGSGVTGITISVGPSRVQIALGSGSENYAKIYAYQVYWQFTATGIAAETAFITAPDTANYIFAGFLIKNTDGSSTPLTITGGWGRDSVTGLSKDIIDNTGAPIFLAPDHVIPYNTSDQSVNLATVEAGLTAQGYTSTRAGYIDKLPNIANGVNALQ